MNNVKDNKNKTAIMINLNIFFIGPSNAVPIPAQLTDCDLGCPITRSNHENEREKKMSSNIEYFFKFHFDIVSSLNHNTDSDKGQEGVIIHQRH